MQPYPLLTNINPTSHAFVHFITPSFLNYFLRSIYHKIKSPITTLTISTGDRDNGICQTMVCEILLQLTFGNLPPLNKRENITEMMPLSTSPLYRTAL